MKSAILTVALLFFVSFPSSAQFCPPDLPYEYCMAGCFDLGDWVVEGYGSMPDAMEAIAGLKSYPAYVSAFVVQLPVGLAPVAVVRRPTPEYPGPIVDPNAQGLRWQVYRGLHRELDAAADVEVFGGWLFSGNDGAMIRVWWQTCPAAALGRMRPTRR